MAKTEAQFHADIASLRSANARLLAGVRAEQDQISAAQRDIRAATPAKSRR